MNFVSEECIIYLGVVLAKRVFIFNISNIFYISFTVLLQIV